METNTNYKYKKISEDKYKPNLEGEDHRRNKYFWKGVAATGILALYTLGQCTPDEVYGKGNNQNIEKESLLEEEVKKEV